MSSSRYSEFDQVAINDLVEVLKRHEGRISLEEERAGGFSLSLNEKGGLYCGVSNHQTQGGGRVNINGVVDDLDRQCWRVCAKNIRFPDESFVLFTHFDNEPPRDDVYKFLERKLGWKMEQFTFTYEKA